MEQTKFELAEEVISQAISELLPPEDPENDEARKAVFSLIEAAEEGYVLVEWPESQDYMEEDWFNEEALLALGCEDSVGSSAYFIPIKRVLQ